jgi:two-component system, OmpR family, sensor histidine kinase ChvG
MALDTGSTPPDADRRRYKGPFSPLTRRILAINSVALGILVGGVLYLDRFEAGLISARGKALTTQGEIIAGALAEAATSGPEAARIKLDLANKILHRLVMPTNTRARLFGTGGQLVADSRRLLPAQQVHVRELPPPGTFEVDWADQLYNWVAPFLSSRADLDLYVETPRQNARDYQEAQQALQGSPTFKVRRTRQGTLMLSVALPVQRLKRVLGAFMLSAEAIDIDQSVREQRQAILGIFVTALLVTVLLSLFLAGTIVRPIRRLANAADRVRSGINRRVQVPDFTQRRDEIGDLSGALRDMTEALYRRMDDVERFAADVAHEIKNPLTSLRSAVETFERTDDPDKRRRLVQIIRDDVSRLDRLISEISDASRLDAELSRAEPESVALSRLLSELATFYQSRAEAGEPAVVLRAPESDDLDIRGIALPLSQVFRNLIDNAVSFSPPGGTVTVTAGRDGANVIVSIEDDGMGIPEENLESIFERFYTSRPQNEAFGTHSGLGLNIAKQIVEAHGGTIRASNRNPGARFVVRLPA